ncbi:MAG: hypothetical protein ACXW0L_09500 [Methylosarcina sp.]
MKTKYFIPNLRLAGVVLLLAQNASYAMPGMEMPAGENAKAPPIAKSMGEPINSPASEFELTYSAGQNGPFHFDASRQYRIQRQSLQFRHLDGSQREWRLANSDSSGAWR